jgi:hypothetical protein
VGDVIQNDFIFGSGSDFLESSGHGPLTTTKKFRRFFVLIRECDETDEIYEEYLKKFYLDSYPPKP